MANKKPKHKKKSENINIPVTPSQKLEIKKKANEKGVAEYARNILFPEQV